MVELAPKNIMRQREEVRAGSSIYSIDNQEELDVPEDTPRGVDPTTYGAYREGLASACADVVVTTTKPDGTHAVIVIKRGSGKCFEGCWWMQGGAIYKFLSMIDFAAERGKVEGGSEPIIEALLGVYRTAWSQKGSEAADTLNVCYVGFVPFGELHLMDDQDHIGVSILTLEDLDELPEDEQHWYPDRVFRLALETMPS